MPSGGEEVRDRYSVKRRLDATDEAILDDVGGGNVGGTVTAYSG